MFWINSIVLFLAGALGAAGMLKERFPALARRLDDLAVYHRGIGVATVILGIIKLLTLFNIVQPMASWVFNFTMGSVMVALGLIQGFGAITEVFKNSPEFQAKLGRIRDRIWNYQELLGLVALTLALVNLIAALM